MEDEERQLIAVHLSPTQKKIAHPKKKTSQKNP